MPPKWSWIPWGMALILESSADPEAKNSLSVIVWQSWVGTGAMGREQKGGGL